jgi:hypothetical protein
MTEYRVSNKCNELIVLSEIEGYELSCRKEYFDDKERAQIWCGIDYVFEGINYCIWLGDVPRNIDFREFLIRKTVSIKVLDKRSMGYYCCYCGKFTKEPQMEDEPKVFKNEVDPQNGSHMLVKFHYDGCRGWD